MFQHWFHLCLKDDAWHYRKTGRMKQRIQESILLDRPRPERIVAHIKTEIVGIRPTKARLIQAFDAYADNYVVADHYRAFTEALLRVTDEQYQFCGMEVHVRSACGLNRVDMALQIASWLSVHPPGGDTRIFLDDISNMDGSVQLPHLRAQANLYDMLSPAMAQHFRSTFNFRGIVRQHCMNNASGSVRYVGQATVKSGAQDTSSGQTCRRIDGIVRCFASLGAKSICGFVFGDDVWLLVTKCPDLSAISSEQEKYGWKTKGCYVDCVESSDFLSCGFARTKTGVHMFPLIGRTLAKLFWTWRQVPERRRAHYRHQVAEAMMPAYQGFTFMMGFLGWHLMKSAPQSRCAEFHFPRPKLVHANPLSKVNWPSYVAARYGLPMPKPFKWSQLPHKLNHLVALPWANDVMRYDLMDPCLRGQILFDPDPLC